MERISFRHKILAEARTCRSTFTTASGSSRTSKTSGYGLVDSWEVPECSFYLPGHPGEVIQEILGAVFPRRMNPFF